MAERNLYEDHYLMIDSGTFWRCDHGSTGWYPCIPCGRKHPERYVRHWAETLAMDPTIQPITDEEGAERMSRNAKIKADGHAGDGDD